MKRRLLGLGFCILFFCSTSVFAAETWKEKVFNWVCEKFSAVGSHISAANIDSSSTMGIFGSEGSSTALLEKAREVGLEIKLVAMFHEDDGSKEYTRGLVKGSAVQLKMLAKFATTIKGANFMDLPKLHSRSSELITGLIDDFESCPKIRRPFQGGAFEIADLRGNEEVRRNLLQTFAYLGSWAHARSSREINELNAGFPREVEHQQFVRKIDRQIEEGVKLLYERLPQELKAEVSDFHPVTFFLILEALRSLVLSELVRGKIVKWREKEQRSLPVYLTDEGVIVSGDGQKSVDISNFFFNRISMQDVWSRKPVPKERAKTLLKWVIQAGLVYPKIFPDTFFVASDGKNKDRVLIQEGRHVETYQLSDYWKD